MVCQKTQTDGSKGILTESAHRKYVGYIKQLMVYGKDIGNIEIHHVLDFLSAKFDKGIEHCVINSEKCIVATNLHIPA